MYTTTNRTLAAELTRVPDGPGVQGEFRDLYAVARGRSLARRDGASRSAVMADCLAFLATMRPGAMVRYDRAFFADAEPLRRAG